MGEDEQSGLSLSFRRVIARASYDELSHAAGGVSRRLVGDGPDRLEKLGLLTKVGSHQHRRYELTESDGGWFKLPCQAIVRNGVVVPFQQFKLRSQVELFALKVYLYLAARRSNLYPCSLASYEKISKGTGVSERNIRQALVFLQLSGLLQDVRRERNNRDEDKTAYGPNIYYLNGHASLSHDSSVAATQGSERHGLGIQEPPDVPQRKPRAAPF